MKLAAGPPMTLGNAAAARVQLTVWCKGCQHQTEPDPADEAVRYGAGTPVPDCHARRVCSRCGSRQVDLVARVKCARGPLLPPRIISPQTVHCSSFVVAPTEGGLSGPQCLSTERSTGPSVDPGAIPDHRVRSLPSKSPHKGTEGDPRPATAGARSRAAAAATALRAAEQGTVCNAGQPHRQHGFVAGGRRGIAAAKGGSE
jgi:hypothetical protein